MKNEKDKTVFRMLLSIALGILLPGTAFTAGHTQHLDYNDGTILGYLAYLPPEYEESTDSFPLIIYLHGAGERAPNGIPNLGRVDNTGLPQLLLTEDIPFIVISPQVRNTWNGTHNEINALLDHLLEKYPRIDNTRVYLTGISDGGKGVFDFPLYFRERVAAIVPISTWPSDANTVPIATIPFSEFPPLPIWGFHGTEDSYQDMEIWLEEVNEEGGDGQMTLLPGGHVAAVWNTVYEGELHDIYGWMLTHVLNPAEFPKWATWRVRNNWVDTNADALDPFLGWLYVENEPWVFSDSFGRYLFLEQENVSSGSGWGYITK